LGVQIEKEWIGIPLWLVCGVLGAWIATTRQLSFGHPQ